MITQLNLSSWTKSYILKKKGSSLVYLHNKNTTNAHLNCFIISYKFAFSDYWIEILIINDESNVGVTNLKKRENVNLKSLRVVKNKWSKCI